MTSKIDREARQSTAFFTQLVTAAIALGCRVETSPALMYSDGAPIFSKNADLTIAYHTYGDTLGVWHSKESYLPGYFTIDRRGYSGASELAQNPEIFADDIARFEQVHAKSIIEKCKTEFIDKRISKYTQENQNQESLPENFVFFPLQTEHDLVQRFSKIAQISAIRELVSKATKDRPIVIKRHPYCNSPSLEKAVSQAISQNENAYETNASIHDLFKKARSVIGANSGVLFEAAVAGLPVYSYAISDFQQAVINLDPDYDMARPFTDPDTVEVPNREKFLGWYLERYCININDPSSVRAKLATILDEVRGSKSVTFPTDEQQRIKQIASELEFQRRTQLNLAQHIYTRQADNLMRRWLFTRPESYWAKLTGQTPMAAGRVWRRLPRNRRRKLDQSYYEHLHKNEVSYQTNNWLVSYAPFLRRHKPRSVLEVGCGNGKFLREASTFCPDVIGVDWVQTPTLPLNFENVRFKLTNLFRDELPPTELACSADVLENMPREKIESILDRLFQAAPYQFHVIACYDDGHSHLSVFDPATWLALFRRKIPEMRFHDIQLRGNDPAKQICVITNLPSIPIHVPPADTVSANTKLPMEGPVRLDLGAGSTRTPGFLSVDVRRDSNADIIADITNLPEAFFGKVDELRSRHALEHLSYHNARKALENWHRVLKPNGKLTVIVPDLEFHARQYLGETMSSFSDQTQHAMAGFYGWSDPNRGGQDWDIHRWGYSFHTLKALLEDIGYSDVQRILAGTDSEPWHLQVRCRNG